MNLRSFLFFSSLTLAAVSATACSSSDDPDAASPSSPDSSSPDAQAQARPAPAVDAASDAGRAPIDAAADVPPGSCNALAQLAQTIDITTTQAVIAQPTGGAIADGVYVLTSRRVHSTSAPEGKKIGSATVTLAVNGRTLESVGGVDSTERETGKMTFQSVGFYFAPTCRTNGALDTTFIAYTARPDELVIVGATDESVYTRIQ